jgi:hypothetical protein
MIKPQPLSAFKEQLIQSGDIQKLIADQYGQEADTATGRFRSGDDGDLWDLIEDNKQEMSGFQEETIEAVGQTAIFLRLRSGQLAPFSGSEPTSSKTSGISAPYKRPELTLRRNSGNKSEHSGNARMRKSESPAPLTHCPICTATANPTRLLQKQTAIR